MRFNISVPLQVISKMLRHHPKRVPSHRKSERLKQFSQINKFNKITPLYNCSFQKNSLGAKTLFWIFLKPLIVFFVCSGFLFCATFLYAQKLPDVNLHNKMMAGIEYTVQQEYEFAKTTFREIITYYPTNPIGYLYLAGTMQAELVDYEIFIDEKLQDSLLSVGEILAEEMIERQENLDWGYYYSGTASAFRAYIKSERGNWMSGIFDGMSAAKKFEECLNITPTFYNAMNGLGTYYYWKSTLPLLSDRREEGITMLQKVIEWGTYDVHIAKNSLIEIFIHAGNFDKAIEVIQTQLRLYPHNRWLLWELVTLYEKTNNIDELKKIVPRLLQSIVKAPVKNYYREIDCRLKLARYAMDDKRYNEVSIECTTILQYQSLIGKTYRDIRKKITEARELLKKANVELAKK